MRRTMVAELMASSFAALRKLPSSAHFKKRRRSSQDGIGYAAVLSRCIFAARLCNVLGGMFRPHSVHFFPEIALFGSLHNESPPTLDALTLHLRSTGYLITFL